MTINCYCFSFDGIELIISAFAPTWQNVSISVSCHVALTDGRSCQTEIPSGRPPKQGEDFHPDPSDRLHDLPQPLSSPPSRSGEVVQPTEKGDLFLALAGVS